MDSKVAVIIVLYNAALLDYPILEVENIELIFVDNTQDRDLKLVGRKISYIPLLQNHGIAKAQNVGIEKARELDCKYVLFFDQDSLVTASLINNLLEEYIQVKQAYPHLAIMGPVILDKDTAEEYGSLLSSKEQVVDNLIFCDDVISSGSIISLDTLEDIGYFDEGLFIDYVDFELCWRAISKGYLCCRNTQIKLYHKIGADNMVLGRKTMVSSPFRFYYQFRNTILLSKRKYVPFKWKVKQFIRISYRFLIFPLILPKGRTYLKYMFNGIIDGIKG